LPDRAGPAGGSPAGEKIPCPAKSLSHDPHTPILYEFPIKRLRRFIGAVQTARRRSRLRMLQNTFLGPKARQRLDEKL